MEYEGKKITREEIKEAVEYVFRNKEKPTDNWIENLNPQQKETVNKIMRAELQDQIDKLDDKEKRKFKFMTVGEVCKKTEIAEELRGEVSPYTLDEVGQFDFNKRGTWKIIGHIDVSKGNTKEQMKEVLKKYKQ